MNDLCDACGYVLQAHENGEFSYGLNLMSFNIRTIASSDTGVRAWDARKAAVLSFINECGADIIGLQEVRIAQFEYISAGLSEQYAALNFSREGGSSAEGLSFIYDATKFKLVSTEKYWLSATPDKQSYGWGESYYRIAVVIVLEHIETGEYVKAINTHGPLNDDANVKAYELIMKRSVSEDDCFTFLCGDFNAKEGELGYLEVEKSLQDCRLSAEESSSRDMHTLNGWGAYEGTENARIIDFCFVSPGENVSVNSYEIRTDRWGSNNANLLSDHYAVQTTVSVRYQIRTENR